MGIFSKRLKEARLEAGLSQEKLGTNIGLDEMSASARMNQYERGVHAPDFSIVEKLAKVLNIPEAYFYAKDDEIALILIKLHRMDKNERSRAIALLINANPTEGLDILQKD